MVSHADKSVLSKIESQANEPIAIVGIGCRFPGDADDPSSYWSLLINGIDAISEVPEERWNLRTFFNEDRAKPGKSYTRNGGFIKGIDKFDADFFGISPREAACMDPQQRILLEMTWEAFADAGIDLEQIAGARVGTFMGIFTHDYNNMQLDTSNRELIDTHTGVGVSMSIVANRISYVFDFTGPSVTLDTACSSSLVALHLACQSIRNGESKIAIAGGANALLKPEFTIATSKASMLSPDGRCKSFDAEANGYVRSEGAGVVVLKPLSAAEKDGDLIYAVINSSVVNQDGRSNGLTVPNAKSQQAAIRAALDIADIPPEDIYYAEAHGTGTFVGDPIEANSIGSILGGQRQNKLIIGSVKSNIGHLEAASGMASLIKVILALKHRQIPPNIHFNTPNPQIEFEKYNMHVLVEPEIWHADKDGHRHACINSFGFGGTNATIILSENLISELSEKEAEDRESNEAIETFFVLPLSASSPAALESVVGRVSGYIKNTNDAVADVCYSAAIRSGHLSHRLALIASNKEGFVDLSEQYLNGNKNPSIVTGSNGYAGGKLAFVFGGMGAQWWAMGRQLIIENVLFRQTIEECDKILSKYADWSLMDELTRDESDSRLNTTQYAQPAIFAIEIALAGVWQSLGIQPDLVCGHSVGEVAAAYVAGALNLDDAIKVIFHRSRLQQKTAGMGGMLAASLSRDSAAQLIAEFGGRVSIAVVNSPISVTLAGELDVLKKIEERLIGDNIFCRLLRVEVPFHCATMDMIKDEILSSLESITPKETTVPLYSTITGKLISGTELNANYWWSNVRNTVEFGQTISVMDNTEVFLEISPHPVLTQSMNECLSEKQSSIVLSSIKRKQNETAAMSSAIGSLYAYGYPLKWDRIIQGNFVRLPRYPWQRLSFWRESEISTQDRTGNMARRTLLAEEAHPLLGIKLNLAQKDSIWDVEVQHGNLSFLPDHQVHGVIVYPGAAYIEMALAATFKHGYSASVIENIAFEKALLLGDEAVRMQFVLSQNIFSIYTEKKKRNDTTTWIKHASGKVVTLDRHETNQNKEFDDLTAIRLRCSHMKNKEDIYEVFTSMGFNYGTEFRGISNFQYNNTESLARIELDTKYDDIYKVYPPLLDSCFQAFLGIIACDQNGPVQDRLFLPMQIARIVVHHRTPHYSSMESGAWCHAHIVENSEKGLKGDLRIYDGDEKLIITIEGFYCATVDKAKWDLLIQQDEQDQTADWFNEVQWIPSPPESQITEAASPQQWIIFGDRAGHGTQLADKLTEKGDDSILVSSGSDYRQDASNQFQIRPDNAKDFELLLQSIEEVENVKGIVYLWPLDLLPLDQSSDATCGCATLLYLIQAINNMNTEVPLWLVTQGGQCLFPELVQAQLLHVEQSPLWGFAQVISLELPQLQCKCIDLDAESGVIENVSLLLQKLNPNTIEDRIAFRNGKSYVSRLIPSMFSVNDSANDIDDDAKIISEEGTYLITGGFGALGRIVTKRLIDKGAKNLVLVGRRGAAGNEKFVEDLQLTGAIIKTAVGDVSNRMDVESIFNDIKDTMPPLCGVVHAAGILDDGVIAQQTSDRFGKIMSIKVQGTWNLHELTLDMSLDFFVCFSSIASLVGSPGQSNYAAGNAFMDLIARYRHSIGLPGISINWGPWAGEGMAVEQLKRLETKGFVSIDVERGLNVLEQLIAEPTIAQISVSPIDWKKFFTAFPKNKTPFFSKFVESSTDTTPENDDFLIQVQELVETERYEFLLQHIDGVVNSVLGFNMKQKPDRQKSLLDQGIDSLMSLEIKNKLDSSFQMNLQQTLLFEHPTINALGEFFRQNLGIPMDNETDELLKDLSPLTLKELNALMENELAECISE